MFDIDPTASLTVEGTFITAIDHNERLVFVAENFPLEGETPTSWYHRSGLDTEDYLFDVFHMLDRDELEELGVDAMTACKRPHVQSGTYLHPKRRSINNG